MCRMCMNTWHFAYRNWIGCKNFARKCVSHPYWTLEEVKDLCKMNSTCGEQWSEPLCRCCSPPRFLIRKRAVHWRQSTNFSNDPHISSLFATASFTWKSHVGDTNMNLQMSSKKAITASLCSLNRDYYTALHLIVCLTDDINASTLVVIILSSGQMQVSCNII